MKASDLKRAQQIVDAVASIDKALIYEINSRRTNQLLVKGGDTETLLVIGVEVAQKALAMQKDVLRARRAELVRSAAQIGLVLA